MIYDVIIVGAGVIGSFIARELSKYNMNVCVVERGSDAASFTSGSNSGIIHAGYDSIPGTMKSRFAVLGNRMYENIAKELDVKYINNGSLVLAFNENEKQTLLSLLKRGVDKGINSLRLLSKDESLLLEPNISKKVVMSLFAPSAGIISPYELTIGLIENAVINGVSLHLETEVLNISKNINGSFTIKTTKGEYLTRYLINAAGVDSAFISSMAGDDSFEIKPRKGEYLLLDKNQNNLVSKVIFQTPTDMGKGILVTPTVHGNLLLGPTAIDIIDKENDSTSINGLKNVLDGSKKSVPSIDKSTVITSFAGIRAVSSTNDFIIKRSDMVSGLINVAGIESPGLTAAPAIALYVSEILKEMGASLEKKNNFDPFRKKFDALVDMDKNEIIEKIKEDPLYGRIICRCENVSEAEIVASIRSKAGAYTLDGVKRRTRAGMGRCQGGFCTPRIMEIMSRELGIPMDSITKSGKNSYILTSKTKEPKNEKS